MKINLCVAENYINDLIHTLSGTTGKAFIWCENDKLRKFIAEEISESFYCRKFIINGERPRYDIETKFNRIIVSYNDSPAICGLRCNSLFVIDYTKIDPETLECVTAGFCAVSSDPLLTVKTDAMKKKATELGIKWDLPIVNENALYCYTDDTKNENLYKWFYEHDNSNRQ